MRWLLWFMAAPYPVDWRTKVYRESHYSFPIPVNSRHHKRKVKVNKLGVRFYKRKEFPQWVCWDYHDPDYLYVNSRMLGRILARQMGHSHIDAFHWKVADVVGAQYLRTRHKQDKIKSLTTYQEIEERCDLRAWLTKEREQEIRNF